MLRAVQMSLEEKLRAAREAEEAGNLDEATDLYQKVIDSSPAHVQANERLMILYRKQKDYKNELLVITHAIEAQLQGKQQQMSQMIKGKKNAGKLKELSAAFMKTSGLVDKKGKDAFVPEPLNKWLKRKESVQKKLKPRKKK